MNIEFVTKHIKTTEERSDLVNLIEELIENNFKNDPNPISVTPFTQKVAEVIYDEINKVGISNDQEEIEKFLEKLLKEVKEIPEIRIGIAIPPTQKLMTKLKEWTDKNGIQNAVFNIEVKPDIVAGAIVMSPEGEYSNYSLSNQLDEYFRNNKQTVMSLL